MAEGETERRNIEYMWQRRSRMVAESPRLEPRQSVTRALGQVCRLQYMTVVSGWRGIHHQNRALHRPDRPLGRRAHDNILEHTYSMRPDHQRVEGCVRHRLGDTDEG